jgi:hypothetical protein
LPGNAAIRGGIETKRDASIVAISKATQFGCYVPEKVEGECLLTPTAIAPITTTSEEQKDDDYNENEFHWILQHTRSAVLFSHHIDFEMDAPD